MIYALHSLATPRGTVQNRFCISDDLYDPIWIFAENGVTYYAIATEDVLL